MKKGQMQSTETIAVLFIFFILILFAIIFYYNYQKVAIKEKQEELLGARAVDTTVKALFLPELICSKGDTEPEDNCIDVLKMKYVNNTRSDDPVNKPGFFIQNKDYYFQIFSYARITVKQLYPAEEEWVLYDVPKPDWHKKEPTHFIVALRDDTAGTQGQEQYGFGYVTVEVYS